ncbi:Hsp70 family protein [Mycobacterium sp. ITM-2016-00318]|uniref:Hsp70 family protein n=1 Tax=Mycobacterium sp. ITM-2016-00318 TaxID=2099693 RepID=UPI000CF905EE|nr:Hsp70 family protein [Mycobacterium sp. ITM-2016-00318]WNG91132.1 Hsp70 family protein [Mycobacterium sp. ITM-2016-00318]
MADGVGLSVGATNLTAVAVGRAAVTRSAVVTLFRNRPLEVGVPSENPRLNSDERGLIITDFVDRVGDPVGIVALDGSSHRGEVLLAEALRELLYEVTSGRGAVDPLVVTHPAHWSAGTVDALREALAPMPEFAGTALVSDARAAVTALHDDPGLPTSGVIALCDFGGSGTSITLVDAGNGNEVIGHTVRYPDLSGDLIDKAVLTQVMEGLSEAGSIDVTGTSAIGQLSRLRAQCRGAKERLSTSAATSLVADLPGHRGEVRLTRNELDDAIRQPLAEFTAAVQETLDRNGARGLAAVASTGGGARIPLVTTTLSERFGVPVITTPHPELTAAIGGGLNAIRGTAEEGATAMAGALSPPTAAALAAMGATQMAPEVHPDDMGSGSSSGLAWSEADEVPDVVAVTDPYDYAGAAGTDAMGAGPRPLMQFEPETENYEEAGKRSPFALLIAGLVIVLLAIALALWFVLRNDESTPSPSSTTVTTTTTAPAPPPAVGETPPPTSEAPPPPPVTQTITEAPQTASQEPPPPPPTSEAPPPPPPTSEAPPPPPPSSEAPSSASTPPRLIPTLPYPTIPGLPFVPAPVVPPAP